MSHERRESGQASVELVALLPIVGVVLLVLWQAVVAGQAVWLSGGAARAAARAQAVGADPAGAARAVLPPGLRRAVRVTTASDGAVVLRLPVPLVGAGSHSIGTVSARARFASQR